MADRWTGLGLARAKRDGWRAALAAGWLLLTACQGDTEPPSRDAGVERPPAAASRPGPGSVAGGPPALLDVQIDRASLPADLLPAARVLVFLREAGERMPLAVEHFSLDQLPDSVRFGPSAAGEVELVVRLSPTGRVDRSASDLEIVRATRFAHPPQIERVSFVAGGAAAPPAQPQQPGPSAVRIALSAALPPGADVGAGVVFVVVRQEGVIMPVAVRRLALGELPVDIELTDVDSMLPSRPLSSARDYRVTAHLSRAGQASRQPGDFDGVVEAAGEHAYRVVLSEPVP